MSLEPVEELDPLQTAYSNWLAARRLENQRTSLLLHSLIRTHAIRISRDEKLVAITRGLVTAASALWRAAFLSDRLAAFEDFEDDDFFITDKIIEIEFTRETMGRAAPDWSFFSHMSRARDALMAIGSEPELALSSHANLSAWVGLSYKECWLRHQAALDQAVGRFERVLSRPVGE